jgi:hypothetical protein
MKNIDREDISLITLCNYTTIFLNLTKINKKETLIFD